MMNHTLRKTLPRALAIPGLLAALALAHPASSEAASVSKARTAVNAAVRDTYRSLYAPWAECDRITSTRFSCTWTAQKRRGNADVHGTARVSYATGRAVVTLRVSRL